MSETKDLKNDELQQASGGTNANGFKYSIGDIFLDSSNSFMYFYYKIVDYNIVVNCYLCDKYTYYPELKSISVSSAPVRIFEDEVANLIRVFEIPDPTIKI